MKKKKIWLIAAPVLALLLIASGGLKGDSTEESGIEITIARTGSIEERADGSGVLEGIHKVDISAERAGLIDSIAVEEGDTVHQGQLLMSLETTDVLASLQESEAQVRIAEIALDQAMREQERVSALREADLASLEEATSSEESVQACRAELQRAVASRTIASDDYSRSSYSSPISGIVTELNIEEGEMAVVGTMNNAGTVLLTIEDMSTFMVRVTMVESEIVDVMEGMAAEITLDAIPDSTFSGTVEKVGLAATSDTGGETAAEYEVLVRMNGTDSRMRSGMSASVEIVTAHEESCVIVPFQSIVERPDPEDPSITVNSVLTVKDGMVRVVPVTPGVSSVMEIQVTGIAAGDSVVSGPTEMLRNLMNGDTVGENTAQEGSADGRGQGFMPGGPGPGGPGPGGPGPV